MTYPYVQAWFDYGVRNGPELGLLYHMAEGGGTVGFLDDKGNPPDRGVSVHAVCEYSGRVVQMLPWGHVAGSLNPADRSVDTGYYGHSALVAVLGSYWTNPNVPTLSMEIEGFASQGPNPAQVRGAIDWGQDMGRRFPTIRGALGHTDQTDTKPCPGLTPNMKAIFAGVGGHGLWTQETNLHTTVTVLPFGGTFAIPANTKIDSFHIGADGSIIPGPSFGPAPASSAHYDAVVTTDATRGGPFLRVIDGVLKGNLIGAVDVTETPNPGPNVADAVAAEHERTRQAAITLLETL